MIILIHYRARPDGGWDRWEYGLHPDGPRWFHTHTVRRANDPKRRRLEKARLLSDLEVGTAIHLTIAGMTEEDMVRILQKHGVEVKVA